MDDKYTEDLPLLGFMDYWGECDECHTPMSASSLLVSDTRDMDKYGNRMFLVIGICPDQEQLIGHPFVCPTCNRAKLFLRLYESQDIGELIKKDEKHEP
jgi:hypothetical protein